MVGGILLKGNIYPHIPFRNPHYCNDHYDKWNDELRNEDSNGTKRQWSGMVTIVKNRSDLIHCFIYPYIYIYMKYIITNKQLHNLMTNHLNQFMDSRKVGLIDNFIIIYEPGDFDEVIIEYDNEDGRLFIKKGFLEDFSSWFPLDDEDSQEFVKNWFETTFNVGVSYTKSS
jgi:hypothetical protein